MSISLSRIPQFEGAAEILSDDALAFIEKLHQKFAGTRNELLAQRDVRRKQFSDARSIDFDPATEEVRNGDWKVAPAPAALTDRRVEITGPATPAKMAINALNSDRKSVV